MLESTGPGSLFDNRFLCFSLSLYIYMLTSQEGPSSSTSTHSFRLFEHFDCFNLLQMPRLAAPTRQTPRWVFLDV